MAVSGVNGMGVAAVAGGAVLVWSGLRGAAISASLKSLISGSAPSGTNTSPIGTPAGAAAGSGSGTSSETGVATAAPPANASEKAWIVAMLTALSAPPTPANISSLTNWIARETPWPPTTPNNPLNTTQPAAGSHPVNSAGVQAYPSAATGINATVITLENGFYPHIVAALRAGTGLAGTGPWNAELSKWSDGGYDSV
jgi:hypothetical protein